MTAAHLIFSPSSLEPLFFQSFPPVVFFVIIHTSSFCHYTSAQPRVSLCSLLSTLLPDLNVTNVTITINVRIYSFLVPKSFFHVGTITVRLPDFFFFLSQASSHQFSLRPFCWMWSIFCDLASVISSPSVSVSCEGSAVLPCIAQRFQGLKGRWSCGYWSIIMDWFFHYQLYNKMTECNELFFFSCKMINEKEKKKKLNWCYNHSEKLLSLPRFDFFVVRAGCNFTPEFNHTMFHK